MCNDKLGNLTKTGLDSGVLITPYWLDINFGVSTLKAGPINPPDIIQFDPTVTTYIYTFAFDGINKLELAFGSQELQHNYKEGSILVPHIHWAPTTDDAGNVKWFIEFYFKEGNTILASGTSSAIQAAAETAWDEQRLDFSTIEVPTMKIGTQLFFTIYRNPSDGQDSYNFDAALCSTFGFHYQVDAGGSKKIISKY